MKVKNLIKLLNECNPNFDIELSKIFVCKAEKEIYDISLDFPLAGIAEGKKHVRFILWDDLSNKENRKAFKRLGCKIRKLK